MIRPSLVLLAQRAAGKVVFDERVALVVIEEVKAACLVGAVVGAVTGADAAVVGHGVKAILGVHGGVDRTNGFTGGGFTLHTGHRLGHHRWVVLHPLGCLLFLAVRVVVFLLARVVAVHANPVHFTTHGDLLLADDRDVVLGLTGNGTGGATHTRSEVDGHAPLMKRIVDELLGLAVLAGIPGGGTLGLV